VVGVGAHQVLGTGGAVEVTATQPLAAVVERVPIRPRLATATRWELPHDFRKAAAEMATMSRLLSEVSILLEVLVASDRQESDYARFTERGIDGSLQIRSTLVAHILRGRSLREFPGASSLIASTLKGELLIFETLAVSVESPFFAKLRPHIKWDKKIDIATVIAALALFLQLGSTPVIPGTPPTPRPESTHITCTVDELNPTPTRLVYARSCREYRRELVDGGVKVAQEYLHALGYDPGPSDGRDGPKTQRAVADFCKDQGVVCTGTQSRIFQNQLVGAMAKRFPIRM
jgi:Putative peptidoglycan binding domain